MCRAFLSPVFKNSEWTEPQDEKDELLIYRCNLGVVSINLPMIYQKSKVEGKQFYDVLDYYLEIARNIGKKTKNYLAKFKASCDPLCFTQGGLDGGDLDPEDTIEPVLKYSTISFGYGGLHELSKLAIGKSLSEDPSFALDTMKHMNEVINRFKEEDHLLWAIYGTPGESWLPIACEQFIKAYGKIKGVTDKGFFTNSFHICVDEDITPIEKIEKEAKFFPLSKGGCINHVRIPSIAPEMNEGIKSIIRYAMSLGLYHSINHAQNRCTDCGHHWIGDDSLSFEENFTCPKCGSLRTIGIRRMNGYLGYNKTWSGKTKFNEGKEKEFSIRKNL
jgi:ribonucleoside-triphosphate reductase